MNSNEVRYTLYRETLQCLLISSIFPDSEKIKHYVRWETNFSLQRIKELNLNSNCLIVIKKTPKTVKTDEMKECFKLLSTLNVPAVWSRQAK